MSSKTVKKNSFWNKFRRIVGRVILWFIILSVGTVVLTRFIPVYYTPLMFIRAAESTLNGEKPKIVRTWTPIDHISRNMVQAVIASEDNLFMHHHGFSVEDIQKAMEHNKKGKRIHGGSTISQQTAKNVFLWPGRTWVRKGLEAYFTVLIEFFWSKERIMEVYLNVIETGKGIYGVQAASETYFGKDASRLSKSQAALIAVCLPNPRRFSPAHPSPYILRRKNQIVNLMDKVEQVDFNK
jgi:monofunctional biosynthetic peptidoglycan transglycosylase